LDLINNIVEYVDTLMTHMKDSEYVSVFGGEGKREVFRGMSKSTAVCTSISK
jgi:hypothetical protein